MDAVFHLGAHRTASTALQKTLGAHGGKLAERGIVYWGPRTTRSGLFDGLIGRPDALPADRQAAATLRVARRVRQAARGGARTLLVSEENVLGSMQAAMAGAGLYADAGPRVAAVARAFSGTELTLALAIRSFDDWWASVRAFRAARGAAVPPHADCGRLALQAGSWAGIIRDIAEAVPGARIFVWNHEKMAHRPEAVIARLTGLMPDRPRTVSHRNAVPGDERAMLAPPVRARLRERYAEDLAWLRAGADGLADFMDAGPGCEIPDVTGQERGQPDDGKLQDQERYHGRLA
jgi:hypothetical protein